ncbi:hypothetical protein GCM10027403_14490 [Arthrobacter tecti]
MLEAMRSSDAGAVSALERDHFLAMGMSEQELGELCAWIVAVSDACEVAPPPVVVQILKFYVDARPSVVPRHKVMAHSKRRERHKRFAGQSRQLRRVLAI